MTVSERFGLALLALFALLVAALFLAPPTARQERATAEGRRTLAEIEQRAANRRYAWYRAGATDAHPVAP